MEREIKKCLWGLASNGKPLTLIPREHWPLWLQMLEGDPELCCGDRVPLSKFCRKHMEQRDSLQKLLPPYIPPAYPNRKYRGSGHRENRYQTKYG